MKTVTAAELSAHAAALLEELAQTREEVVVTKDGVPVARLVPPVDAMRGPMWGTARQVGDLVAPLDEPWECESE